MPNDKDARFPGPEGAFGETPLWTDQIELELLPGAATFAPTTAKGSELDALASFPALQDRLRTLPLKSITSSLPVRATLAPNAELKETSMRQPPDYSGLVTLSFEAGTDVVAVARELSNLPEVVRAVPVPGARPPQAPLTEPLIGSSDQVVVPERQWYSFRCQSPGAWERSTGAGVVVADIDWGYRTTHEDLSGIEAGGAFNAFDGGSDVSWGGNIDHGTGVAGLAAAAVNDLGMAGFGYQAAIWPIQANGGPGAALPGNSWARGIDHVRTTPAGTRRKVAILEVQTGNFGNYEQIPSVNAAIRAAIAEGVVVCVAAGNGDRDAGIDDGGSPIPATGSILVGATSYAPGANPRAWFSNFGSNIVVSAPGDPDHDLTCDSSADNAYRDGFGGTSGATPKVAGTAALMLAVNPALSHQEVREFLRTTGTAVETSAGKPVGTFLNAAGAVEAAWLDTNGRLLAVGNNQDGRLEVLARGTDESLWHLWQTAPNNGWSDWSSLGGEIDRLAIARNADGRLEAFARGADRALWHRWQTAPNNGWSAWSSLGGEIDLFDVGRNQDGRLEVFARGADRALWHIWQTAPNNGWSGWASLGGDIDRLAVGSNADGRLEVFARGADRALWHIWQTAPNNGWSGWASLGGVIDLLVVGNNADGRLEVFARGADRALWHIWQTAPSNGWSGWTSLGGVIDLLAVGNNADGRLEVFGRGADRALWHIWQTAPSNGWSGWSSLGGQIDRLAVGRNQDGRLEVFTRGTDAALWHIWQTAPNNGWSDWSSLGGTIS